MNAIQACPSPGVLQAMLEGRASEVELDDLGRHLDECEGCRGRFDDFARGQRVSAAGMARITSAMQSPALRDALEKLAKSPWGDDKNAPAAKSETLPGLDLPKGYLDPPDDPQSLGKLGPYEILERVGSGGMAVVFKGREPKLNRIVAIKVLAPHLAANGTARQRFFREAQAAAAVTHDHVVTIHAVEEASGLPILVMQYVPGQSLRQKIDKCGPLDVRRVLRIALQAASGLAAAHAQGLIHRDIKPENILLENGVERVRITDFGLATAADDVALTQTGFLAGTPQYMSPEQAQGRPIDGRSDLFSLGSVIYEMCTGRAAFRASNPYAAIHRVCHEEPRPIRQLNPDVPEWLCEIVDRLIDKDARGRFQSANELIEELQARLVALQNPDYEKTAPQISRPAPRSIAAQYVTSRDERRTSAVGSGTNIGLPSSSSEATLLPGILLLIVSGLTFLSGPLLVAAVLLSHGPGMLLFVYPPLYGLFAIPFFVCGVRTLRRQSYSAAVCGAAFAMLPVTPFFPLTFLLGLCTFLLLQREDARAAFVCAVAAPPREGSAEDYARGCVSFRGPALGLQGAAGIAIFFAEVVAVFIALPVAIDVFEGDPHPPVFLLLVAVLVGLVPGAIAFVQLMAASRTLKTESVVAARIAAMCGALPYSPAWLIGLPMALWMWVTVHRRWALESALRKPPSSSVESRPTKPNVAPIAAAAVGAIVLTMVLAAGLGGIVLYVSRSAEAPTATIIYVPPPNAPVAYPTPPVGMPPIVTPEASEFGGHGAAEWDE